MPLDHIMSQPNFDDDNGLKPATDYRLPYNLRLRALNILFTSS
jgi:hypothetical protein